MNETIKFNKQPIVMDIEIECNKFRTDIEEWKSKNAELTLLNESTPNDN